MILRYLTLAGLVLGVLTAVPAQNPGYLGKKLLIQAQTTANPALWGPSESSWRYVDNLDFRGRDIGFNLHWGGKLSYAIDRTTSAFLQVNQYQTGMTMTGYTPAFPAAGWDEYELLYLLKSRQFLGGVQFFKLHKGALAPLGAYFGAHAGMTRIQGEVNNYRVDPASFPEVYSSVNSLQIEPTFTYWSAGFELGVNHVFLDFMVLNLGIKGNFPIHFRYFAEKLFAPSDPLMPAPPPYPSYKTDHEGYNNYFFRNNALARSFFYQFASVHLGLGFLIF